MRQKKGNFERFQFTLRLTLDIIATLAAWFLSYYLRFFILPGGARDSLGLFTALSFLALLSSLFFLFLNRLYESNVVSKWSREVGSLLRVSVGVFLTFVVFYYYVMSITVSRIALAIFLVMHFMFLFIGRRITNTIIGRKVKSGQFLQRALLVGYGKKMQDFYDTTISHGVLSRIKIIGQYLSETSPIEGLAQIDAANLEQAVKDNDIDMVVIGFPPTDSSESKGTAVHQGLELLNAQVFLLSDIPRSYAGSVIRDFYTIPAVQLNNSEMSLGKRFIKRTFDIISCSFAVLLLSPLFLILALMVKLSSKGPVFFRQKRVTRDGRVFEMLKFRSMRTDMPEQNGPHWTEEDDPRVTKLGRILRKTSLDELPQFFNVLSGSMSLIGPRPERPELVEEFKKTIPGYDLRHKVKAGISGWAQVNGLRGNTSIEKRVAFDLYYIRNWSVFLDFKIVILTFFKGFINKNAY
jgi:exopolysaccharide biosynthesis polyprenyl glycosylphosphotransferase